MVNKCYKKTKKSFEKKRMKDIKIFLKKKNKIRQKRPETDTKLFPKKEKKTSVSS